MLLDRDGSGAPRGRPRARPAADGTATAAAPARIDLAGGTVDIWPICILEPDAVTVNLAIDRYATATVKRRRDGRFVLAAADRGIRSAHDRIASLRTETALPLHREVALAAQSFAPGGLEVRTRSRVPAGSGLGGSSTLFVAATRAMLRATGGSLSDREFLRLVVDMEARIIGVPTGTQDYVAAMYGGLSAIRFPAGSSARAAIAADRDAVAARIVLAWTGLPHDSATNNWAITKAYLDGDAAVRRDMTAIAAAARDLETALLAGDLEFAARAIDAEWTARKRLAPGVTTPKIERIGRAARKAGALAMKVCGAGGGGCVFLWCGEGTRAAVAKAVAAAGGEVLRFRPAPAGALSA
jgi:D-glycero-alpha-D-manno-heptose-7-phosphate kinase